MVHLNYTLWPDKTQFEKITNKAPLLLYNWLIFMQNSTIHLFNCFCVYRLL